MSTFKLQSAKAIGVLVDTAITHTQKGDELVHTAAIQCLAHAAKCGDTTLMDRLVKGLGKSVRVQALRLWVHDFSPIRWNGDDEVGQAKATIGKDNAPNPNYRPYNVEAANTTPFYAYAPGAERTARPLTFDGIIGVVENLELKIARAIKEGGQGFEGDLEQAKLFAAAMKGAAKMWIEEHHAGEKNDPTKVAAEAPKETKVGVPAPAAAPRGPRGLKAA